MNPRSWHALGAGKFTVQSAPVFVRYAMVFLALTAAAAALSAGSLSASVANPTGRRNARITVARQRFEWGNTIDVVGAKTGSYQCCRDNT